MGAFVKDSCDAPESFLASCVPNLELYNMLAVDPHHVVSELHPNRHVMFVAEFVLYESC